MSKKEIKCSDVGRGFQEKADREVGPVSILILDSRHSLAARCMCMENSAYLQLWVILTWRMSRIAVGDGAIVVIRGESSS